MKRTISEFLPFLIVSSLLLGWMIGLWKNIVPHQDWALYVYAGLVVGVYISILRSISLHLEKMNPGTEANAAILFFVTSILLVLFFAFGWDVFGNFSGPSKFPSKVDCFYFSVVAFTTLGFGDYAPNTDAGKIFLCIEALMGVTHMVAFFAIIIGRVISRAPERVGSQIRDYGTPTVPIQRGHE